jgi:glycosyltransferase involved in cell wall biosynthesis
MKEYKKITFVGHTMDRGGASHVLCMLANGLAENGYDVELVFFRIRNSYPLLNQVRLYNLFRSDEEPSKFQYFKVLYKYIKNCDSKILVSFLTEVNIITLISTFRSRKRVIISERNDPKVSTSTLVYLASRIMYNLAEHVVFQTQRVKKYYSRRVQSKSQVIRNPIDVEGVIATLREKKIVSVGKLYPQKNHKLLINAFAQLCRFGFEHTLHIYGEGPLRDELNQQIVDVGLEERIFLEGNQPNIPVKIKDAQLFVLSSDYEGLSNALLEALSIGLPCISTNCAGTDEVIEDGVNGIITPVGDLNALSKAMFDVLSNVELQKKFMENNSIKKDEFSSKNIVDRWLQLIEG